MKGQRNGNRSVALTATALLVMISITGLTLCGCSSPKQEDEKGKPVLSEWEFPMLSVMTGPVSYAGRPAEWAIQYAAKKINDAGGIRGIPVKITTYDTAFDPARAVTMMSQVVDKSLVVFGPMDAPGAEAAGQLTFDAKVPNIASFSFQDIRDKYQPYAIAYMTDSEAGDRIACEYWLKLNPDIKSIVLFYTPTDPSITKGYNVVKDMLAEKGIALAGSIEVQTNQVDVGPSVVKAMNYKPDGYFAILRLDEYVKVAAELNDRGMREGRRLLATFSANSPQLFKLGKGVLEGTYIWNKMDPDYKGAEWQALETAYQADFDGQKPSVSPVLDFYNSLYAVKEAIEALELTGDPQKLPEERQKLAEYLYNSKEFLGIQGPYSWKAGEKIAPIHFFQVHNDALVAVDVK